MSIRTCPLAIILAKDLLASYFPEANAGLSLEDYKPGDKAIPFSVIKGFKGKELAGIKYEQLLPYAQPNRWRCIPRGFR